MNGEWKMNTKILFSDLDGTLLNAKKEITPASKAAIEEMIFKGHKFMMATGRPIQSALKLAESFGFIQPGFYISSYNGALIYDCYEKKTIQKLAIPYEHVRFLFDKAHSFQLHCHTYSRTHVLSEKDTEELELYKNHIQMPALVVPDIMDALEEEPIKIIVMNLKDQRKLVDFQKYMADWADKKMNSVFSQPILLEYGSYLASKGNSLKFMCQYFQIPIENSVAVGDEQNDISMLQAAGVGVVMKNGTDIAMEYADYITKKDNNEDGIQEVIEKFIL